MRSIPFLIAIIFLAFYGTITVLAWKSISPLTHKKAFHNKVKRVYWFYSALIWIAFMLLFIFPFSIATSKNYSSYYYFNALLFIDILCKAALSVSSLIHFFTTNKNRKKIISAMGMLIASGLFLTFIWSIIFGANTSRKEQVTLHISNLPTSFDGLKIVHISDIHLGSFHFKHLLEKVNEVSETFQPDLFLFTGDLVNNFSEETEGWQAYFQTFEARLGKFSILGNHDYGDYFRWKSEEERKSNFEKIVEAHQHIGFKLLRNESTPIISGNDTLYLVGVENWGHPPFPQYANLEKAEKGFPKGSFRILLTHDPAHWEAKIKENENYQLTLSGHSHGLQWGIKPAGIEFSMSYFTRKNWGGLYENDHRYLYVNRGLGTIGIPWRIDMPAEITLITLRRF